MRNWAAKEKSEWPRRICRRQREPERKGRHVSEQRPLHPQFKKGELQAPEIAVEGSPPKPKPNPNVEAEVLTRTREKDVPTETQGTIQRIPQIGQTLT